MNSQPPEPFLWGVATSAYQTEGGYNGPGEPRTNWAAAEERGDVARTGAAARFWHCYEEDFARCRLLGLNAFRLGIEWSRVQPTSEPGRAEPPAFDTHALDRYVKMLASCRAHGLEPVVTLHHFVHPAWLGGDPWLDESTPEHFEKFVRTAVSYLVDRLPEPPRWFITINEPNMLVLNSYLGSQFPAAAPRGFGTMMRAYVQLLRAHLRAYRAVHEIYAERSRPAPRVTLNNYCSDLYWSDKLLLDLLNLRERGVPRNRVPEHIRERAGAFEKALAAARLPLHRDISFFFGSLMKRCSNWLGRKRFSADVFAPLLDELYAAPSARAFDYVGVDYYDPFAAHVFRWPVLWDHEFANRSLRSWMLAAVTSKWWDWRVLPRGLHFFCKHYAEEFGRPVLIAENGMALRRKAGAADGERRDRMTRSQFLRLHVHEVVKIVKDDVPLAGYLHWSLFDNYEWGTFTPRFGLFSIDFPESTERHAEDFLGDRPSETYAALIQEARMKMSSS